MFFVLSSPLSPLQAGCGQPDVYKIQGGVWETLHETLHQQPLVCIYAAEPEAGWGGAAQRNSHSLPPWVPPPAARCCLPGLCSAGMKQAACGGRHTPHTHSWFSFPKGELTWTEWSSVHCITSRGIKYSRLHMQWERGATEWSDITISCWKHKVSAQLVKVVIQKSPQQKPGCPSCSADKPQSYFTWGSK